MRDTKINKASAPLKMEAVLEPGTKVTFGIEVGYVVRMSKSRLLVKWRDGVDWRWTEYKCNTGVTITFQFTEKESN